MPFKLRWHICRLTSKRANVSNGMLSPTRPYYCLICRFVDCWEMKRHTWTSCAVWHSIQMTWYQDPNLSILSSHFCCKYVFIITLCPKKYAPWCLIITLANVDRFSKFFHRLIHKKILCVYTTKDFHLPCTAVYRYTALWNSKMEECYQIFTLNVTINMFN